MRRLIEDSHSSGEPDRSDGAIPAASEFSRLKHLTLIVDLSTDGNDSRPLEDPGCAHRASSGERSNFKVSSL
jgi:hypothetical protein